MLDPKKHITVLVVLLAGCHASGNALWGSIEESFSLDFDRVNIRKKCTSLMIEYIEKRYGGVDKVCRLVIETEGLSLKDNLEIPNDSFIDHMVMVERVAATGGDFPPQTGGHIAFAQYEFRPGGNMSGDFNVLFGNGRNLLGTCEGKVEAE